MTTKGADELPEITTAYIHESRAGKLAASIVSGLSRHH